MEEWVSSPEDILWEDAYVAVGITDMRGINNQVSLSWNNESMTFDPGTISKDVVAEGISASLPLQPTDSGGYRFEMALALNGSSSLNFIPVGKTTNVSIESTWPHPSFSGAFLPEEPRDLRRSIYGAMGSVALKPQLSSTMVRGQ